jgi:chaperonin GroES
MSEILAIGDGITSDEKTKDSIKVGDKIIASKFSGTEVKLDNEEYTIIKLNEVLAIVE